MINEPTVITNTNYINTSIPGDVKIVTEFSSNHPGKFDSDDTVADQLALIFTDTKDCLIEVCGYLRTY